MKLFKIILIAIFALLIALFSIRKVNAQITGSFGAGIELKEAIPVQLMIGYSWNSNEILSGYTVFYSKNDANYPTIYSLRYGYNILSGNLEIMPMIGLAYLSKTTRDDLTPEGHEQVTQANLKPLIGLKLQAQLNARGGLFVSIEHAKLNYLTAGFLIRGR